MNIRTSDSIIEVNTKEDSGDTRPVQTVSDAPIIVDQITKQFADQVVVDHVSFDVAKGTVFGFIGPSGSGKTTTVRMLTGIYQPDSGTVKILGKRTKNLHTQDRKRIGYMPQHFVLYPDLTVAENMSFAASIYGVGFGRSKRIRELLEFVELWEDRHKRVRQISGGMQRRLSLATTLVHGPDLLFLDEPTTGLDPVLRRKFWDHFHELKQTGITLFVTTQYVSDAAYCDLVGMMVEGKLVAMDTPEGLRRRAMGGDIVIMHSTNALDNRRLQTMTQQLPFVKRAEYLNENEARLTVEDAAVAIPELIEYSKNNGIEVESINEFTPVYDDVFIALIGKEGQNA